MSNNLSLRRRLLGSFATVEGYIDCTYNITDTSSPTKLIGLNTNRLGTIKEMVIDGEESISPIQSYTFDSTGEHTVRMYVTSLFSSAEDLFNGCSVLTSVKFDLSENLKVRLFYTFYGCTKLKSIDWGNSNLYVSPSLGYMFYKCSSLENIDLSNIDFKSMSTVSSTYAFQDCDKINNIIFGDIDKLTMNETFWSLGSNSSSLDFTRVKSITSVSRPFVNATQPNLMDFGECDLSTCNITRDSFFDFHIQNYYAKTIMLGKPMNYPDVISKHSDFEGEFIYNLNYDYSNVIYEFTNITPIAYNVVNKTLKIRFCTENNWITDSSANFTINGVAGIYTSQGIWEFSITADTYKYPILYNGTEVGEAIVKDEVQQILIGNNDLVYQVIDFSSEDSFDPNIIISNDGWEWESGSSYYGLFNNTIDTGQETSIVINTGMIGEIILTTAQASQTYYHYGKIYNSSDTLLHKMEGQMYQSHEIIFKVLVEDGIIRIAYSKENSSSNPNHQDKLWIKKLEHYNWPELPA